MCVCRFAEQYNIKVNVVFHLFLRFPFSTMLAAVSLWMLIGCGNPLGTPRIIVDADTRRANGILEEVRKRDPNSLYITDSAGPIPLETGILLIAHGGPE